MLRVKIYLFPEEFCEDWMFIFKYSTFFSFVVKNLLSFIFGLHFTFTIKVVNVAIKSKFERD